MTIALLILAAINLLTTLTVGYGILRYTAASDRCLALELDLVRGDIADARRENYGQHRHTCAYIGSALIEDEVFKALGIPKNPPVPIDIQMQKRAICQDEGLREHFKLSPETAKTILANLDAEGIPQLPWDKPSEEQS